MHVQRSSKVPFCTSTLLTDYGLRAFEDSDSCIATFFLLEISNQYVSTQGDTVAKANYISNYLLMPSAFSGFFKVTQCVIKLPKKVYCNLILDCKDKMNPPK